MRAGGARRARTAGAIGEFALIRRLTAGLARAADTPIGPGDDAAVVSVRGAGELVVTTDAFVEGRHWRPAWARLSGIGARLPAMMGARLAAANLSDVAAMGALPRWAVLSAGLAPDAAHWLERAERALARALERSGATLVGGNLSRTDGPMWLSVTLIGELRGAGALRRSGARAGDWIAITGSPGRAAAFERLADRGVFDRALARLWSAPAPRVAFAHAVARRRLAGAAIDISDGASGDLAQLAGASGVSAAIDPRLWPRDHLLINALASRTGRGTARGATGAAVLEFALGESDDYELIFAVPPARRSALERLARETATPLSFVGRFMAGRAGALHLIGSRGELRPLRPRGFDHFAPGARSQR